MISEIERIGLIEARTEITDLVYRYALNIRGRTAAACMELFTEDGVFEVRQGSFVDPGVSQIRSQVVGRDAIGTYLNRAAASETRMCPVIHNLLVSVNGHEAESNCVMIAHMWPSGQQMIGEYKDRYRYENGWRFSVRSYTMFVQPA